MVDASAIDYVCGVVLVYLFYQYQYCHHHYAYDDADAVMTFHYSAYLISFDVAVVVLQLKMM